MKRLTLIILVAAAIIGVASLNLTAQPQGTQVVFINSQAAIAAHPAGEEAAQLQEQARTEIGEIQTSLQELANRVRAGEELSPADQERYQTLLTTLQTVQARYEAEINAAAGPAIEAVNQAIAAVAEANGYTIVMDAAVAGPPPGLNLIVYSQPGLDITDQVIEYLQSQ